MDYTAARRVMEGAERAGTAALVQKQIDQIEADDDRDRGSMVLVSKRLQLSPQAQSAQREGE